MLKAKHLVELDAHLQANLYLLAKAVAYWVKETFRVSYTESGMTAVLRRLGYVYKKPRLVPGKADREAQTQFLETYDHIRNLQGQDDPIYFWMRLIRNTIRCLPAVGSSVARSR